MNFHYDKKVDALAIKFSDKAYAESEEVQDGIIFDYDKNGRVIGIEILDASKVLPSGFKQSRFPKNVPMVVD